MSTCVYSPIINVTFLFLSLDKSTRAALLEKTAFCETPSARNRDHNWEIVIGSVTKSDFSSIQASKKIAGWTRSEAIRRWFSRIRDPKHYGGCDERRREKSVLSFFLLAPALIKVRPALARSLKQPLEHRRAEAELEKGQCLLLPPSSCHVLMYHNIIYYGFFFVIQSYNVSEMDAASMTKAKATNDRRNKWMWWALFSSSQTVHRQ